MLQTNPGEQFFMFSSLAAWLIRKLGNTWESHYKSCSQQIIIIGRHFEQPQEFDDPNTTISNILEHVSRDISPLDLCLTSDLTHFLQVRKIGVTIDFAPSKLKQGFGEQALFVLDRSGR